MASATFEIDPGTGTYGPAGTFGLALPNAVVKMRLADPEGITGAIWRIYGTYDSGLAAPTLTLGGTPYGSTCEVTMSADVGQAYGIECDALDANARHHISRSSIKVAFANARLPVFVGESTEENTTHAAVEKFNDVLENDGGPVNVTTDDVTHVTSGLSTTTILDRLIANAAPALRFKYESAITLANPTDGYFRFDTASPAAAAQLRVSAETVDTTNVLSLIARGFPGYLKLANPGHSKYLLLKVLTGTNNTTHVVFDVEVVGSLGTFTEDEQLALVIDNNGLPESRDIAVAADSNDIDLSLNGNGSHFIRNLTVTGSDRTWTGIDAAGVAEGTTLTLMSDTASDADLQLSVVDGSSTHQIMAPENVLIEPQGALMFVLQGGYWCAMLPYAQVSGTGGESNSNVDGGTVAGRSTFVMTKSGVLLPIKGAVGLNRVTVTEDAENVYFSVTTQTSSTTPNTSGVLGGTGTTSDALDDLKADIVQNAADIVTVSAATGTNLKNGREAICNIFTPVIARGDHDPISAMATVWLPNRAEWLKVVFQDFAPSAGNIEELSVGDVEGFRMYNDTGGLQSAGPDPYNRGHGWLEIPATFDIVDGLSVQTSQNQPATLLKGPLQMLSWSVVGYDYAIFYGDAIQATTEKIFITADAGTDWTPGNFQDATAAGPGEITWTGDRLVAVFPDGHKEYSSNGLTWTTAVTAGAGAGHLTASNGAGVSLCIDKISWIAQRSIDGGLSWLALAAINGSANGDLASIKYFEALSAFVLISLAGEILISTDDGVTWSRDTMLFDDPRAISDPPMLLSGRLFNTCGSYLVAALTSVPMDYDKSYHYLPPLGPGENAPPIETGKQDLYFSQNGINWRKSGVFEGNLVSGNHRSALNTTTRPNPGHSQSDGDQLMVVSYRGAAFGLSSVSPQGAADCFMSFRDTGGAPGPAGPPGADGSASVPATGATSGFAMTVDSSTGYGVAAGTAEVQGVSYSFAGLTDITPTALLTHLISFVAFSPSGGGSIVEQTTEFTREQRRDVVPIGVVVHVNKTTVDAVNQETSSALDLAPQISDILHGLGFVNVSGNVFAANGANLNINKSVGVMMYEGANWSPPYKNPHHLTLATLTAATFQYRLQDGTNGATGIAIDPDNYDVAGTLTAVPNNRYTVQRIYSFVSNNVKIQPGQAVYTSMADALMMLSAEVFTTEPSLAANGMLRGFLIVKKGATDLTDSNVARFVAANKFGEQPSGGSPGDSGNHPALVWVHDASTDVADPAAETVKVNAARTEVRISKTSLSAGLVTTLLTGMPLGILSISNLPASVVHRFRVLSATADTTHFLLSVTDAGKSPDGGSNDFSDGEAVFVALPSGSVSASGALPTQRWAHATVGDTTAPATGEVRFSSLTPASVTTIRFSSTTADGAITGSQLGVTELGVLRFASADGAKFHSYLVTGVQYLGAYVRFTVTYIGAEGSFSALEILHVSLPSGVALANAAPPGFSWIYDTTSGTGAPSTTKLHWESASPSDDDNLYIHDTQANSLNTSGFMFSLPDVGRIQISNAGGSKIISAYYTDKTNATGHYRFSCTDVQTVGAAFSDTEQAYVTFLGGGQVLDGTISGQGGTATGMTRFVTTIAIPGLFAGAHVHISPAEFQPKGASAVTWPALTASCTTDGVLQVVGYVDKAGTGTETLAIKVTQT